MLCAAVRCFRLYSLSGILRGVMGSSMASFVWRDVVGRRWINCTMWLGVISSIVWSLLESFFTRFSRPFDGSIQTSIFVPSIRIGVRFLLFQVSQVFFLAGLTFILEPEERDHASFGDLAVVLLRVGLKAMVGRSREGSFKTGTPELRNEIRATLDYMAFATLCVNSGFLALISLLSCVELSPGRPSSLEVGLRGASLGLLYAGLQFFHENLTLSFPIIQRGLFFALKMGVPSALSRSFKLALALLPIVEGASLIIIPSASLVARTTILDRYDSSFCVRQLTFATATFFVVFSWEIGRHIVQVLQTKQHVFAPPLGSATLEADSTESLLMVLEDQDTGSLVQYHAFLDLCILSETNVETWRRAAFFDETGDTYKRVIMACLKKLDSLTVRLAPGLEPSQAVKGVDFAECEMQSPQIENDRLTSHGGLMKAHFQDFQVCSLCARAVASLTSCSRFEDRYGIAQLHGCNIDVVSSLLSCLLVVEAYLGRRNSGHGVSSVPSTTRRRVPSGGVCMEAGKRQSYLSAKRTANFKRAYAMADVLRTSLYQVVSVFRDEMIQVGFTGIVRSVAEVDWLSQKKPLFGSRELHLQKLRMLLETFAE